MTVEKAVEQVVGILRADSTLRQAVKYLDERLIVKGTRRFKPTRLHDEVLLNMGKPNFAERHFVKACIRASEPFPVKKVQTKEFS
jgi:hypothetical protein